MNNNNVKKLLAVLSSAALAAAVLPAAASVQAADTAAVSTLLGDANSDGKVSVADAVTILQFIANKDKYNLVVSCSTMLTSTTAATALLPVMLSRYSASTHTS